MTKNIIKACKKAGIKKIVYISGLGVSKNNESSYFVSKYKAEQEIINSDLDYTIFRASYIIGKKDYLTKFLSKQMENGVIIIPGSGKYLIQPIFVDDVAKIILESIVEKKFSNKIVDLVGPQKISFEDFVNLFAKNTKTEIQKVSLDDAYHEAKHNPRSVYGLETLNILVGSYTSDVKRLKKLSDIKLTKISNML